MPHSSTGISVSVNRARIMARSRKYTRMKRNIFIDETNETVGIARTTLRLFYSAGAAVKGA